MHYNIHIMSLLWVYYWSTFVFLDCKICKVYWTYDLCKNSSQADTSSHVIECHSSYKLFWKSYLPFIYFKINVDLYFDQFDFFEWYILISLIFCMNFIFNKTYKINSLNHKNRCRMSNFVVETVGLMIWLWYFILCLFFRFFFFLL